jgi:hypothetical protein
MFAQIIRRKNSQRLRFDGVEVLMIAVGIVLVTAIAMTF